MHQIQTHHLSNGLKVIHEYASTEVIYCGYLLHAGTRYEPATFSGLAHFCEHMTFKGTQRRKATEVINCIEGVGGDLNAYTNKDEVVYHIIALKKDLKKAVDLLSDIVFFSTYPQKEICKEVEVVADEIESYKDSPSDFIYDEFEGLLFQEHPLGRDILGDIGQLKRVTTADLKAFTQAFYQPQNATFFILGDIDFKALIKLLTKATESFPINSLPLVKQALPAYIPSFVTRQKGTHQAHIMVGNRALPAGSDDFPALFLLNNLLGGPSMNSLLNMSLRERSGLVYNVESNLTCYADTGVWSIYLGCDKQDIKRCLAKIDRILDGLCQKGLSRNKLQKIVHQIEGQIKISADLFESNALSLAKTFAHYNVPRDLANFIERIHMLTPDKIQSTAQQFFSKERRTTLIYN